MATISFSYTKYGTTQDVWTKSRKRRRLRRTGTQPRIQALFDLNFLPSFPSSSSAGKFAEKLAYEKRDMVQMGPFKSSPIGFGTCAFLWCQLVKQLLLLCYSNCE
jgi:hypothetical protein